MARGQLRWPSFVILSLVHGLVLGDRQFHVAIHRRPRVSGEESAQFLAGDPTYLMQASQLRRVRSGHFYVHWKSINGHVFHKIRKLRTGL